MPTDTTVNNLVINKLTKAQYDAIQSPSDTELYLVPDVIDTAPTSGSDNMVTSGGVYTALSDKQDTLTSGTNIKTVNGESILGSGDLNVSGDCIAYPSFEIDSNGHLIMSGGQQGLFTLVNGHLMYNY